MVQITSLDIKIFLIHALALKLWLFEVCIGSHSLAMFALRKFTGVRAGYVEDPYSVWCYLDACLHCGAPLCIQLNYVVVSRQYFFLLSISVCLKNRYKTAKKFHALECALDASAMSVMGIFIVDGLSEIFHGRQELKMQ